MKIAKTIKGFAPTDGFRVLTIGSGAPPQDLERSSPCTMVQYKDKFFIIDMGYGASHRLFEAGIEPAEVKNVLFTHLHSDHSLDYGYFMITGWHDGRDELHVTGPKGTVKMHNAYTDMYDSDIMYRANLGISLKGIKENVFFNEVDGGESFELDGVKISTLHVPHTAYTVSYKFEADGKKVVVSGDLMYNKEFAEFAKDADMIVFDANQANSTFLQERGPSFVANLEKSHATISQIGQMAQEAESKSIILTHLTPGTFVGEMVKTAAQSYNGEIIVAKDLLAVEV